jgi:Uma2 family endonuclease
LRTGRWDARGREIERKLREYFAAGTRLAWIIDPPTRTAKLYASAVDFTQVLANGKLEGRDVLIGFELPLATLFQQVDEMMAVWDPPSQQ